MFQFQLKSVLHGHASMPLKMLTGLKWYGESSKLFVLNLKGQNILVASVKEKGIRRSLFDNPGFKNSTNIHRRRHTTSAIPEFRSKTPTNKGNFYLLHFLLLITISSIWGFLLFF